jgi:hypothetical protein
MDVDWSFVSACDDVHVMCERFYSKLYEIFDLHVPLKKCTTRHYPVWFNSAIITKIRKKSNVFKKYKRTGLPSYFLEFKNLRRDVKREIDVAFRDYISKVQENLVGDPKKFWSFVNNRNGRSRIPSRMSNGGHSLNSFSEIVNSFATHFKNSYHTADAPANLIDDLGNATLHLYTVSDADILESIGLLKSGLCSADDGIPAFLIKDCKYLLLPPLLVLFNLILKSGEYPIMWKVGRVCPIFKSGDRSLINNYRPVTILSNFSKLFESVLYRFIYSNVKCHISESQHGFVSSRSTITNLVCITDYIANAIDNNTQVDVIYTDFSKAFDKLNHNILLSKLSAFSSFRFTVNSGIPQGSNLGPLLFLLFINDINEIFTVDSLLYADDLKLYWRIHNMHDCIELQSNVDLLSDWCSRNKLLLNKDKCISVSYSRKHDICRFPGWFLMCILALLLLHR